MSDPNVRRVLYGVGIGAMLVLAIAITSLVPTPRAAQDAVSASGVAQQPTWEQLMARSVQARKAGKVGVARILLGQAESLAATFHPQDMRRAHTRMGQAEFELWSGEPRRAEQAYREAVALGERIGGPSHPEMISLLEGLANFYFYRERYDEAVPVFERILDFVRSARPRDPHEEARRLRNLAQVHQHRGRHAEAVPLYVEALRLVEASPARTPGEVAEYLQAAAECHLASGEAKLAEPLAARALALVESVAGPDTLDVVPYLKTLADATRDAGHAAQATQLYRRGIGIVERVSGAEHSDLAPFLRGLGHALKAEGKMREADAYLARAQKVTEGG